MAIPDVIKALTPPFLVIMGTCLLVLHQPEAGFLVLGSGLGAAPGAIGRRQPLPAEP